ncbi:hypothetical protein HDV63DRAFT_94216 [Trichoderma sp. SZMC 28014]
MSHSRVAAYFLLNRINPLFSVFSLFLSPMLVFCFLTSPIPYTASSPTQKLPKLHSCPCHARSPHLRLKLLYASRREKTNTRSIKYINKSRQVALAPPSVHNPTYIHT